MAAMHTLPFGLPGIATIAYELLEQTDGSIGTVIAPAGHGAIAAGDHARICSLGDRRVKLPVNRIMLVFRLKHCSPMASGFQGEDHESLDGAPEGATLAEGVRVARPIRGQADYP